MFSPLRDEQIWRILPFLLRMNPIYRVGLLLEIIHHPLVVMDVESAVLDSPLKKRVVIQNDCFVKMISLSFAGKFPTPRPACHHRKLAEYRPPPLHCLLNYQQRSLRLGHWCRNPKQLRKKFLRLRNNKANLSSPTLRKAIVVYVPFVTGSIYRLRRLREGDAQNCAPKLGVVEGEELIV